MNMLLKAAVFAFRKVTDVFLELIGLCVLIATFAVINTSYLLGLVGGVMSSEVGLAAAFVLAVLLPVIGLVAWASRRKNQEQAAPAAQPSFITAVMK